MVDDRHAMEQTPRPAPRLNVSYNGAQGTMEPPQPPWKRGVSALTKPVKGPHSPLRLLTERVSWSEIMSHSQESRDDENPRRSGSPQTPVFRFRQPSSPPARMAARRRPSSDDESCSTDKNEGRFKRDYCSVSAIGTGQFSTVYRARHVIDQCDYAVKKTTRISRGLRQTQLREAFALANVSMEAAGCPNIVRYYSSWVEDERLHIQTELCECSLRETMQQRAKQSKDSKDFNNDSRFREPELVEVLRDVANGLKVLHACGYIHLDIKPDNILVGRGRGNYKIADLGLAVAALGTGCDDISEGDCRYLAKEVLRGDLANLPKADVFSLGLVMYELSTNPRPLPFNGDEWAMLRDGQLDESLMLPLSPQFVVLLRSMVLPVACDRPSCHDILQHSSVAPDDQFKALREEVMKQTLLAERYWQEILSMKKQELLSGVTSTHSTPSGPCSGAYPSGDRGCQVASPHSSSVLGPLGPLGPLSLRRERTS